MFSIKKKKKLLTPTTLQEVIIPGGFYTTFWQAGDGVQQKPKHLLHSFSFPGKDVQDCKQKREHEFT